MVLLLAAGCALDQRVPRPAEAPPEPEAPRVVPEVPELEAAPDPDARLALGDLEDLSGRIDSYFEGHGSKRLHVQLDRPMYKPGETVWLKTTSVMTRGLEPDPHPMVTYELLDPQGQVVETKAVPQYGGSATNDFVLPEGAPGGKWTLRATAMTGEIDERPFVVASYATPRIRKELEFVREAYGPGDRVEALVELTQGTGAALSHHEVAVLLQVAGETVLEETMSTDATGAVLVSAQLPEALSSSDGLLTVLVTDGGITESISRSVPIVIADLRLSFFPEGGDLVAGLPGRLYFEATNAHGEPADVQGVLEDDLGRQVAAFRSVHDGMGRLPLQPEDGRTYTARITQPVGIETRYEVPAARSEGCTLRTYDDVRSTLGHVRVGVRCSTPQEVVVTGVLRETTLDTAQVLAGPAAEAVVHLDPGEAVHQQGAIQVTVFDPELAPLAERLVYRNHGKNLDVTVTPDREKYGPRDPVVLAVETRSPSGDPIAAELALSVVDDAVIGLADDKEGHMLSRLYLEPELLDSPKDPAFYFDPDEALAARGMDLVMGTKGHRRFEWRVVFDPPPLVETGGVVGGVVGDQAWFGNDEVERELAMPAPPVEEVAERRRPRLRLPRMNKPQAPMAPEAEPEVMVEPDGLAPPLPVVVAAGRPVPQLAQREIGALPEGKEEAAPEMRDVRAAAGQKAAHRRGRRDRGAADNQGIPDMGMEALGYFAIADEDDAFGEALGWAAVRVFPAPDYSAGFSGTRTDFRDTVHWAPTVQTGGDGRGEVRFYLSDAVTTFRVTTEGLGQGFAGHHETTLSSVLPVSIATRLPPAVSAGDRLEVPLTVTNTRDQPLDVWLQAFFDHDILAAETPQGTLELGAGQTDTFWVSVDVAEGSASVPLKLSAEGGGLFDAIEQTLRVVPAGFPRSWSASGEGADERAFTFQLDQAVPGSLVATATWHPSPVSNLIEGMEGMIATPGGCFEQTSSTNWPNVAILNYLEAHDGDPRLRVASAQALEVGYAKLSGYQVDAGGFETWGSGPGKEALSAFGLLQFSDMQKVYPVDDAILERDVDYLLSQRTGKGGFDNTGESAHGYGSAPKEILDGFITYALVASGQASGLDTEIAHQAEVARGSEDPYVLSLAARSLHGTDHPEAEEAVARLSVLQADDGSFPGAVSSITRSYEANLLVESTALAALALMDVPGHRVAADKAVGWITAHRQGGTWGATQATALALAALTRHAEHSRVPRSAGQLSVEVNGKPTGQLVYDAEQTEPLVIAGLEAHLRPGANEVVVRQLDGQPLPFTVDVQWVSVSPSTAPGAELTLRTELAQSEARLGDTVRLTARVDNATDRIVPSPIARVGLPAGLEAQTWQLEQLQERGQIAFFETRPREVTLYWDGIHPDETHEVALDLTAVVPGTFTGSASSAYPYYNDDDKAWTRGLEVAIGR